MSNTVGVITFEIKNHRDLAAAVIELLQSVECKAFQSSVMVTSSLYGLKGGAPVVNALDAFFRQPALPERDGMSMKAIHTYLARYHILEANWLALFADQKLGERVVLNQRGLVTHEALNEGDLFVWCGELMYLKGRDTYTVQDKFFYGNFHFNLDNEPAYWVGTVKAIEEVA